MLVILSETNNWLWAGPLIAGVSCLLIGGIIGFFVARKIMNNYMEKNPPITEKMVEAMMSQMGRKPSKKQIAAVMATMNVKGKK